MALATAAYGQPIDTTAIVQAGGIRQFVSIKGSDRHNPILLFLHGGPGKSLIPFADAFTGKLGQYYTVVQWDQRETGETAKLNHSPAKLRIQQFGEDAYTITRYLLRRLGQKKLYLVSHSWGSMPGFYMAAKHPELLYAYIPISPMVKQKESIQLTKDLLVHWADSTHNTEAQKELATVHIPYQSKDDLFYAQKWLFLHNEVDFAKEPAFKTTYYNWMDAWFGITLESMEVDLFKTVPRVNCPIYFFEGVGDIQTYYTLAADYYKFVQAPKKEMIWFEQSGHTIFNSEPGKLQEELIKILEKTKHTNTRKP